MDDAKNQDRPLKTVIMGMENAGKTTIVNLLTQEDNISPISPPNMIPTKGVKSSFLFQDTVMIWDFAGQKNYRNEYLANPESYFHMISLVYYVVDIQDYYRLISSTMYFKGVFNLIRKYSPEAKIVIIFHKMDPNFNSNKPNLKQKFLEKIEPFLLVNNKPFKMYDTTIFDLNSIKTAFSQELE